MNYSLLILSLILIASCGSVDKGKPKGSDPAADINITNQDFEKKQKIVYSKSSDHYELSSSSNALASESAERLDKSQSSVLENLKDPLGTMILLCYRKDFDEGFALAQIMFDTHQNLPTYWNQVATCHLLQGNERKALLFYNKALEVTPNYVPALNNIGVIYSKNLQDQKALVAFKKSRAGGKFTKTPRYNLAFLLLRYGLAKEAIGHFKWLTGEAPQDFDLRAGLANAFAINENWQEAWDEFNKIPDSIRTRSDVGINMAFTAYKIGQNELARNILSNTSVSDADKKYAGQIRQVVGE